MKALGSEIAKNIVLAGIKSLTVIDSAITTPQDLGAQFFLTDTAVGLNRAQAAAPQISNLNPRVNVVADPSDISTKPPSFFSDFNIVIATDVSSTALNIINTATRLHNVPFYAAGLQGFYGYIFADLIAHEYIISRETSNIATKLGPETRTRSVISTSTKSEGGKNVELVTKRELYSTYFLASDIAPLAPEIMKSARRKRAVTPLISCWRALWAFASNNQQRYPSLSSHDDLAAFTTLAQNYHNQLGLPKETLKAEKLRSFLQNIGSEIAPVAAVVGGQVAQDVINVLGQKQQPIQNFVFFDGMESEAPMYSLHPEGELGKDLLPMSEAVMNSSTIGESIMLD